MVRRTRKKDNPHWPRKYYAGLDRKTQKRRRAEILRYGKLDWRDPAAYVGFKTDVGRKTKSSRYTQKWNRRFPDAKSIEERSKATGIPKQYLQESYDRGMAAWRTGHRVGATQQQWGYARASSFALCGKTALTTDSDLRRSAMRRSQKARKWFRQFPACKDI
jgi:hypothetical protein